VEGSPTVDNRDGANPAPALTISGLSNIEHLWLGGWATKNIATSDNPTIDADYTALTELGSTGNGSTANTTIQHVYRIFTGTSDTFNATLDSSNHRAIALVALMEVAGGSSVNGSGAATIGPIAAAGTGESIVAGLGQADLLAISVTGAGDVDVEGVGDADLMPINASGAGVLNVAPNAPTLVTPADDGTFNPSTTQLFDWTFSDDNAGDSQSAWALRRLAS
jgi:hypothetical protein